MFVHAQLTVDIVWDDVLWRAIAWYVEDEGEQPVVVEKSGRVPLPADGSIGNAVLAAARALVIDRAEYRPIP